VPLTASNSSTCRAVVGVGRTSGRIYVASSPDGGRAINLRRLLGTGTDENPGATRKVATAGIGTVWAVALVGSHSSGLRWHLIQGVVEVVLLAWVQRCASVALHRAHDVSIDRAHSAALLAARCDVLKAGDDIVESLQWSAGMIGQVRHFNTCRLSQCDTCSGYESRLLVSTSATRSLLADLALMRQ